MDNKKSVGKRSLAFSRNLGLTISLVLHVILGSGFVVLNTVTTEEEEFELLETQSIELNSLSGEELEALLALLESDPEVSDSTNLPVKSEPDASKLLSVSNKITTPESKKKILNLSRNLNRNLSLSRNLNLKKDQRYQRRLSHHWRVMILGLKRRRGKNLKNK